MSSSFYQRNVLKIKAWAKTPGFQKYLRGTGWPFLTKIVLLSISFFVTAYTVRYLGPTNYGQLSYAVSFVSLFSFIATLGIDQVLYRDLVKHPDQKNVYMGTAFVLKLIAAALATIACVIGAYLTSTHDVSFSLIIIISGTFMFNSLGIIIYEFQAEVRSKELAIISFITLITLSVIKIVLVLSGKGIIYFAFVLLLEAILNVSMYCYLRAREFGPLSNWSYDSHIAKLIFIDSWPLIFSAAFSLIYARIDQVMIKHMIDTPSVGLYDAAVRVSEAWYFVPSIIVSSLFPAIVNAKKHSEEEYNKRLGRLGLMLFVLAVVVALPIAVAAPLIIKILYGAPFLGGVPVLQIYIWAGIGTSLALLSVNYLVTENLRYILFFSYLIAMVSNVVLNFLFIPHFGIAGSAWATFISYNLGPLSLLFFTPSRKRIYAIIHALKRDAFHLHS